MKTAGFNGFWSALFTFLVHGHLQSAHDKYAAADTVTKGHFELIKTKQEAHMAPQRRRTARVYRPGDARAW
jgi:hypothetical protein